MAMTDPVLWLGGWASGLDCWRQDLERLYPGREHAFLDAHAVLEKPALLAASAAALPARGVLVAWSLGSLLVHKALQEGAFAPSCRLVSVSPIFDFCAKGGPWPRAAVTRMARRLSRERDAVLSEFRTLAKGDSALSPGQEDAWLVQSQRYSQASLERGLEMLGGTSVSIQAVGRHGHPAGHFFLASSRDPLAPPPGGAFPSGNWVAYPRGHLPFLDYPELLNPLLSAPPGWGGK
jgi:hypothetical protein